MSLDLDSRPLPTSDLFAYNRSAVLHRLRQSGATGSILMFGFPEPGRILTDYEPLFRQESYFWYMTGISVPNCAVYIDISTGHSALFYPDIPSSECLWSGPQPPLDTIRQAHGFDEIHLFPTLPSFISSRSPTNLHSLTEKLIVGNFSVNCDLLIEAISEQRQIKSDGELSLMRYAAAVNNQAYRRVLQTLRPGLYEFQVEAELQYEYVGHYCMYPPFQVTVCSGELCAILHYHKKTRKIGEGELVLIDTGGEYEMYCADNTRTFPASGKFSDDQRAIYTAVLEAQKAVIAAARPGVKWTDMALLSATVMGRELVSAGLLIGEPEVLVAEGIVEVFYPHGLGHAMGLDVHEVAGWPKGVEREKGPHMKWLRLGRVLEKGMVVTVEPGCYFIPLMYEEALADPVKAKFINREVCERMRKTVGGVRIEDDILITENGCENLSVAIPKEIEEIEELMKR